MIDYSIPIPFSSNVKIVLPSTCTSLPIANYQLTTIELQIYLKNQSHKYQGPILMKRY